MKSEETPTAGRDKSEAGGGGIINRLTDQTRGLFDDVREWVELKVQLIQLEIEEKIETVANHILASLLFAVLAFVTFIFALVALSLGLGKAFGDPLWGFLATTVLLAVATAIARFVRLRVVSSPWSKKEDVEASLDEHKPIARLPEAAVPAAGVAPDADGQGRSEVGMRAGDNQLTNKTTPDGAGSQTD